MPVKRPVTKRVLTNNKYRAIKTEVDGIRFDSKREAARYLELKTLLKGKKIGALSLQPKFSLVVNGQKICTYIADFAYLDLKTGLRVIEDVKGVKTPIYNLKKKLVRALHGIEITEVK